MISRLRVCVLQPDYSTSTVDYRHYDPTRDLAPLLPDATVDHVALDKRTVYRQLQGLARKQYDIFVNLCEGYLDWDVPSVDVIHALDQLKLPYTGPDASLYDPSKPLMKYVAYTAGVATPRHRVVHDIADLQALAAQRQPLRYPLFVKPAHSGDSRGIEQDAMVSSPVELEAVVQRWLPEFPELLVEEYVDGREFTVLVAATADGAVRTFRPIEYRFPPGTAFKTYALKTSDLHPDANHPVVDQELAAALTDAAARIFRAFGGVGYARLDFRMDRSGALYFLEINFTCSVFYPHGYEGSADHILAFDGTTHSEFLQLIIDEGMARHRRNRERTIVRGDGVDGFGTFAARDFDVGDVVFPGEERPLTLVTRAHVERHWNDAQRRDFRRYAFPVGNDVYGIWSEHPEEWRPQNHSCAPNTAYRGLDVVALHPIKAGEELTLDYGTMLDEHSEPFACACGAQSCRGWIAGNAGNTVARTSVEESGNLHDGHERRSVP